jgi:hypothetical protein
MREIPFGLLKPLNQNARIVDIPRMIMISIRS